MEDEAPSVRRLVQWDKPPLKFPPPRMISRDMSGLRTDEEVRRFVESETMSLIQFGSSWCEHCHKIFPTFYSFSKQSPRLRFAVTHIDGLETECRHIEKTPTFTFYRTGRKVSIIEGAKMEVLKDRLWLFNQEGVIDGPWHRPEDRMWLYSQD